MLLIATGYTASTDSAPPTWVIVCCYTAIGLGTMFGGWRIVRTMGQKITKLKPVGGFCAETGGAITLFLATALGVPVSTTHTITAAIVGVILNLAVWFALHVLFAKLTPVHWLGASVDVPVLSSLDIPSAVLSAAAAIAIFRFKLGMIPVLLASSLAGVVLFLVLGLS